MATRGWLKREPTPPMILVFFFAAVVVQVSAFLPAPRAQRLHAATLPTTSSRSSSTTTTTTTTAKNNAVNRKCSTTCRRLPRRTLALPSASQDTPAVDGAGNPSTEDPGTPSPPEPVAPPSYRRLYDSAMSLLESELELEPYPIPEGLEGNSAVVGRGRSKQSVETSITAFRASKFRQIRAALVETDGPTQVLNFVMFPHPSYDVPIFGADLVSLPGVHLVVIDLQPAYVGQEMGEEAQAAVRVAKGRHLEGLPWGGDLPEAAQKYFSPHCIWSKIAPGEAIEQRALDAMMDYLREYLNLVKEAVPVEGDGPLAEISAGQADYCDYRRVNDPARGMLTRFYGAEWTEAAIEGILFDYKP